VNVRALLRLLGKILCLLALAKLLPIACCLWYGETDDALAFLLAGALTLTIGLLLSRVPVPDERLYRREGILIVVVGWLLASLFGALPYLLTGDLTSPVDALFESASGFTTTGASIFTDIESKGRGLLFWRSMTQWLGGLGIIVIFVALLSELGPGTRFLYRVEVPGPTKEILHPRVHATAMVLLRIYLLLSAACLGLLLAGGMSLYDALTHTFSTMSTGGFSPRNASIAAFPSPFVQIVLIAFMTVAGVNFSLFYMVTRGKWRLWEDRELGVYLALLAGASAVVALDLVARHEATPWRAVLDGTFQAVSLMTTTGFASADYDRWPDAARATLLFLMMVGGSAGSTASGVKVMRVLIALKTALREVRLNFSPSAVIPVTIRGAAVPEEVTRSVSGFIVLYAITLVTGATLLTFGGTDLVSASSAALACLGNVGPGLAKVGPTANYAFFGDWEKLLLVVLMWLGRLEVLAIVAVATRSFWKR
jgi:trk system potassium uptake protein TrkH